MKKNRPSRLIAFALAVLMVFTANTMSVSAWSNLESEDTNHVISFEEAFSETKISNNSGTDVGAVAVEEIREDENTAKSDFVVTVDKFGSGEELDSLRRVFFSDSTNYEYLYYQLNNNQKVMYEAMDSLTVEDIFIDNPYNKVEYVGGIPYYCLSFLVEDLPSATFNGYVHNGELQNANSSDVNLVIRDLLVAITAYRYDRADAFWSADMIFNFSLANIGGGKVKVDGYTFGFSRHYIPMQEVKMYNDMISGLEKLYYYAASKKDNYSKLKAAYEYLAKYNQYNYPAASDTQAVKLDSKISHTAYSALIVNDGYLPVCDGFSKALKIISKVFKIPCVLVVSTDHMWNNIQMEDKKWYNVDLTWDTGSGNQFKFDYFLVGKNTKFGNYTFAQEHPEINPFEDTRYGTYTLRYPPKSDTAYVYNPNANPSPTPNPGTKTFPDVQPSSWYYKYVMFVANEGIFNGHSDGTFKPEDTITRAEFTQALSGYFGVNTNQYKNKAPVFSDVPSGKWYSGAIAWAKEQGYINGSGGKFRPSDTITREEICVIFYNVNGKKGDTSVKNKFSDHNLISSWATKAVYYCANAEFVKGDSGAFRPRDRIKRCEVATIFYNILNSK